IEGIHAVELCDALLNIAVKGNWPPVCSHWSFPSSDRSGWERDQTANTNRSRRHRAETLDNKSNTSSNVRDDNNSNVTGSGSMGESATQQHVLSCNHCKSQLQIDNPEIFRIIIQLLYTAMGKTDDRDIVYILN